MTEKEEKAFKLLTRAILDLQTNLELYYKDKDIFSNPNTLDLFKALSDILEVDIEITK